MRQSIYIAMLIGFISESAPYLLIPALPDITYSFGITKSQASSLLSAYYLTLSLTFLFAGAMGNKFHKKQLLAAAIISIFTGSLTMGFSSGYTMLCLGRVLQALGAGIIVVVTQSWIGQISNKDNITRLFSYLTIVLSFAPLVAPIMGGFITDYFSWRYSFYLIAALSLISLFLLFFTTLPIEQKRQQKAFTSYKNILFKTPFFTIIATMLVCFLFQGSLMSYSSFLFIEQFGLTPSTFGFISAPIIAGIIIGQFPVIWFKAKTAYTFSSIIIIFSLLVSLVWGSNIYSLLITIFLFNVGFGGHNLIATRTIISYFASERSYSSALMNFLSDFTNYIAAVFVQILFIFTKTSAEIHYIVSITTIVLITLCYIFFSKKITEHSVLQ